MSRLNDIVKQAANLPKKPSKKEIFEKVVDLIESEHIKGLGPLDFAELYAYFMPATPATPKKPIDWVAKAVPRDDVRMHLNWIYSDGTCLYGTDGHRLHAHPLPRKHSYKKGFYDRAGNFAFKEYPSGQKFPDTDRVTPEENTPMRVIMADLQVDHGKSVSTVYQASGQTVNT